MLIPTRAAIRYLWSRPAGILIELDRAAQIPLIQSVAGKVPMAVVMFLLSSVRRRMATARAPFSRRWRGRLGLIYEAEVVDTSAKPASDPFCGRWSLLRYRRMARAHRFEQSHPPTRAKTSLRAPGPRCSENVPRLATGGNRPEQPALHLPRCARIRRAPCASALHRTVQKTFFMFVTFFTRNTGDGPATRSLLQIDTRIFEACAASLRNDSTVAKLRAGCGGIARCQLEP